MSLDYKFHKNSATLKYKSLNLTLHFVVRCKGMIIEQKNISYRINVCNYLALLGE